MDTQQLKEVIKNVLDEKNAQDIREITFEEKGGVADLFILATGKNTTHVRNLADLVKIKLEELGVASIRDEGIRDGRWAAIDYGNIIVHIFNTDTRDFFCLEKLWGKNES